MLNISWDKPIDISNDDIQSDVSLLDDGTLEDCGEVERDHILHVGRSGRADDVFDVAWADADVVSIGIETIGVWERPEVVEQGVAGTCARQEKQQEQHNLHI